MELHALNLARPTVTTPRKASGGFRYHEPVDSVGPSFQTLARPPVKAPRSFLGKALRVAACTAIAVTVSAASLGAIGYFGNPDLTREPVVTVLADQNPVSNPTPPGPPGKPTPPGKPVPITVKSDRVVVVLPKGTVTEVASQAQKNPRATAFMREKAREAEESLTNVLREMKAPEGSVLLDARLPLPTGERAFFHVGPVDLPSLGVHNIEYRELPLVVSYQTSPIAPSFKVGLETFQASRPPRPASAGPDALYLGSVKVSVSPRESSIPVDGSLTLSVERDGKKTAEQMAELRAKLKLVPHDSPRGKQLRELIARHEARIQQGRDLPQNELLDSAFQNQTVQFQASVKGSASASGTYHVWMGKDVTRDGRADLHLAGETDFSQLDGLTVELNRLTGTGPAPDGFLNRMAHDQVTEIFKNAIHRALPEVTDSIRRGAIAQVGAELQRGTPWVADQSNQVLTRGYGAGVDVDVPPLAGAGGKHLHYGLERVQVAPQGLLLELESEGSRGKPEAVNLPFELKSGELAMRLPGGELNRRLRDTIDWKLLMEQIRRSQGLRQLQFGKNGLPRFVMDQGRPAITFDIVAQSKGGILFDARVATGIVVPLQFRVHDGKLEVKPIAKATRTVESQEPLPFNPIDLLPTRLLSNMIAEFVAQSHSHGGVAAGLTRGFDLDLDKKGLQFVDIEAQPRGNGAPDLVLKLKSTPATTDFLLKSILER